jgi:hypothetical protein
MAVRKYDREERGVGRRETSYLGKRNRIGVVSIKRKT